MKILRLDLRAFGPFTDVAMDLSAGGEGLHIVYGPNEAGKSSALRALEQMLFGIPTRSSDNFIHAYPNMRVGATLCNRGGQPLAFLRRKAARNTLLGEDNATALEENALAPFLGGLDRGLFASMFGIGHEQLVRGGKEIVHGSGDVGPLLFAAGAGIADLQRIRARLDEQAGELFVPRGSSRRINQGLRELDDAKRQVRQTQLPSEEWTQHSEALAEARRRRQELDGLILARQCERNRWERIRQALPVLAKRKELRRQLSELANAPGIPPGFADQRREAVKKLELARRGEQMAREELERIGRDLAALDIPETIVAHALQIEELPDALGGFRKAQKDLPGLAARRERARRGAAEILQEIRADLSIESAEQLRLTGPQQLAIRNLGKRHEAVLLKRKQAEHDIAQAERDLAAAEAQVAQAETPCDARPLRDAVRRAQNLGDIETQAGEARKRLGQLEQEIALSLKRLPLWSRTVEDLEQIAVPADETVARFAGQWAASEKALARLDEGAQARGRRDEAERKLEQLQLEGDVPTEEDLVAARRRRDHGWELVLRAWQHGADAAEVAEFVAWFPPAPDLPAAYPHSVRAADDVADRLRREEKRVAQRALHLAEQNAAERQIERLADQHAQAADEHANLLRAWSECWQPAGIQPLAPQEMRAWLLQHRAVLQQAEALRGQRQAVEQIADRMDAHGRELQQCLASIEKGSDAGPLSLAQMLQRSQAALDQIQATADRREQACREVQRLQKARQQARTGAERAEAELKEWSDRWALALEPLGFPPATTPEQADYVLGRIADLLAGRKEEEELTERIDAIHRDAEEFARRVANLTKEAAPDAASAAAEQAAEQLIARLRRATADQQLRDDLVKRQTRFRKEQANARKAGSDATAALAVMCVEAGCATWEDLPQVEQAAESAARLRDGLAALEDQLAGLSAGGTIETLVAEAETVNGDLLPGQIEQLDAEIRQAEAQRLELQTTVGSEEQALRSMDTGTEATEAAEQVQTLLARLDADVAQYVRLRLAWAVLREGIERYRKKNEGPVLRRASELFRRLTRGSFEALSVDFDDQGHSVLKGVRPDKGQLVELHEMSEGTADQLYLALRLASLESHLEGKEPAPFIVDDVLIGFDDDRAAVALETLADFSQRTQVIFFTHHAHLVELAESRLDASVRFVHHLPPSLYSSRSA